MRTNDATETTERDGVAAFVSGLRAAGINLEDSSEGRLVDPSLHEAKVAAVRSCSPGLFINARIDTYWLGERATVEETLRRAHRYVAAGADGIFVPGGLTLDALGAICREVAVPVNVLAFAQHTPEVLRAAGVARISTGSLLYREALSSSLEVARRIRDGESAPADVLGYAETDCLSSARGAW